MKKTRKLIAILLAMFICLSMLAACSDKDSTAPSSEGESTGGSEATPSPSSTYNAPDSAAGGRVEADEAGLASAAPTGEAVKFAEEIHMIIDNTPVATLDPFRSGGPAQIWSCHLIFDRLIYYIGDGQYIPSIATEWHTDDYKTFTFKLRDDVVFHNGEKLKASDVVFTFEWGANPEHSTNATWGMVDTIVALDDYTVQIDLKRMDVDFLFRVSQPAIAIVNEKAVTEDPLNGSLIGTGAFVLTEFVENNYMVYERNDNYFGEPPITRKLTLSYISEISSRTIMMLNGEAQMCMKISGDDMDLFIDNPDFWIDDHVVNNPSVIRFNMTDRITGDLNFRLAVAHCINRADLALVGGGGWYFPDYESGSAWGYSSEFRNKDIPMIPEGDLDLAKQYLDESSYDGSPVEILTANLISTIRAAEVLQQQLGAIGIETYVTMMEGVAQPDYVKWGNNQSQINLGVIPFTSAAFSIRSPLYPESPGNVTSYNNPAVTELLDRAASELDYNERGKIYREIQELVSADVPYLNMWYLLQTCVYVQGIGGFGFPGDNLYDFRYVYWQIEG